jgi:hypothetical protein
VCQRLAGALAAGAVLAGCGSGAASTGTSTGIPRELLSEARPIGVGVRFHPPVSGPVVGTCRRPLGRRFGVHIEVFGANRVVIVPAGIGTEPPRELVAGRVLSARCYGSLVTLDPTGVLLVRAGQKLSLSDVFRAWGQPLSTSRLGSFTAPDGVRVFVDGHRLNLPPERVVLTRHEEIVLEAGPYVPPHRRYAFPPGA